MICIDEIRFQRCSTWPCVFATKKRAQIENRNLELIQMSKDSNSTTTSASGVVDELNDAPKTYGLFFKAPIEYKSAKFGYVFKKNGIRGTGYYRKFDPCPKFRGSEPGYYFSMGNQGLGYYLEGIQNEAQTPRENDDEEDDFWDRELEGDQEEKDNDKEEDAADDGLDTMDVESVCFACNYEKGMTKLMRINTPFFGELLVSSFSCDKCGYKDTKTEPIGDVMEKGVRMTVSVDSIKSLSRRVVTTKYTTISFPALSLEIPPGTSAGGRLTTIEGLVQEATVKLHEGNKFRKSQLDKLNDVMEKMQLEGKTVEPKLIEQDQEERAIANRIDEIVLKLVGFAKGDDLPFVIRLDDPAGKAAVENPAAPSKDPFVNIEAYVRTKEQDKMVGVQVQAEPAVHSDSKKEKKKKTGGKTKLSGAQITSMYYDSKHSDVRFASPCGACGVQGETRMAITKIPNFSEIILMCFVCEKCGFKDAEVKPGGKIQSKGQITTLHVTKETAADDLRRDVLKSADASLSIPELGFESGFGIFSLSLSLSLPLSNSTYPLSNRYARCCLHHS